MPDVVSDTMGGRWPVARRSTRRPTSTEIQEEADRVGLGADVPAPTSTVHSGPSARVSRCTRPRRTLPIASAATVLQRAKFTVQTLESGVVLAHYVGGYAGRESVAVILCPAHTRQFVMVHRFVDGVMQPYPLAETGQRLRGEWRWHDVASATRRALSVLHQLRAGVR